MLEQIVTPSSQVQSILPQWISEQYPRFVYFMQRAFSSEERQGFAQDLLQNLLEYKDFDFYKKPIVETGVLQENINLLDTTILTLMDGFGFPEKNGTLLINDEIILYDYREGNVFHGLTRGASGTRVLGTFIQDPVTRNATVPRRHNKGDTVVNLSVLFLSAMLNTIHETYAPGIASSRVHRDINRGQMLENIKDFFQSKGSKLGIKALFKILFGENDVDVFYPGDQMIKPSHSTWVESFIVRVVPIPFLLSDPERVNVRPDRLINRELVVKSYNDLNDPETENRVYGRAICDYASSYQYGDQTQYEFFIQKQNVQGTFPANPFTKLTRALRTPGSIDDRFDVYTITVETTLGFPDSGVLFIDDEAISYTSKSFNQFFGCTRGYIGVWAEHSNGSRVYGPYFIEGAFTTSTDVPDLDISRETHYLSRSWPLGLVEKIDIEDPGLLHTVDDEVYANGPGRVDPRDPIMGSFIENYDDKLSRQVDINSILDVSDMTWGVSGVYFDKEYCFVSSTNLPDYKIGPFSTDQSVGPMRRYNNLYVFPRRNKVLENKIREGEYIFDHKGVRSIGSFIDGVPAYSNVSPDTLVQGCITKYEIVDEGKNYINPTLLVNEMKVNEVITVGPAGNIASITTTDETIYEGLPLPDVRITGGEGAVVSLMFDRYGRVNTATVLNGGRYYNDVPSVTVTDASKQGKGATFSVKVDKGEVVEVNIENAGLDYNPNTSYAVVTPRGSAAEVKCVVQFYQYDRYQQVLDNPKWMFDEYGGFLWENTEWYKDSFGYIYCPPKLFDDVILPARLNTELYQKITTLPERDYILINPPGYGSSHGKLVGWAFDGNPIYSGAGYKNGTDDSDGWKFYVSGYTLADSRDDIIASGGNTPGCAPPSVDEYPLGTFVEDYIYNPNKVSQRVRLMSELEELIQTQELDYIAVSKPYPLDSILNENNAVKCNTPEFPAELYPDGVWCYFCTEIDGVPQFPYIIGKTFENRPISQMITATTQESINPIHYIIYNPNAVYKETELIFDYDKVERLRNRYLSETKDELEVRIDRTSKGTISEIVVVDGLPANSKVGDLLVYDNYDTGGSGALGIVSQVEGQNVISGEGKDITTNVISHTQQILVPEGDYVFVPGSIITTTSGASAIVVSYDYDTHILVVYTFTKNLIQPGDSFRDNKNQWVEVGSLDNGTITDEDGIPIAIMGMNNTILNIEEQREIYYFNNERRENRQIYFAQGKPTGDLTPGDLWFSDVNGRLYIYFNDGESSQWVCTQPIGMRPFLGASDTGIGNSTASEYLVSNPQEKNVVIISNTAPDARNGGGPIEPGDLWWSSHTGIMYIFINEWICTDPNATVPMEGASDVSVFQQKNPEIPSEPYECQQNVVISYLAPKAETGEYPDGTLWWSTLTGKMYIKYSYQASTSWVVTNPVGMLSTQWGSDTIIDGDGGTVPPPIIILPELPEMPGLGGDIGSGTSDIWFEHLVHFDPGDNIRFLTGAPGTSAVEDAKLQSILVTGAPACGRVLRGEPKAVLEDGTPVLNTSKSLFIVTTEQPHGLRHGDVVFLENSLYDEVNGEHTIVIAGRVQPAQATTVISEGEVVQVNVTDPGYGYSSNFYVTFYGGKGTGGYAYVEVDTEQGGIVEKVTVVEGGVNYEEPPEVFWGSELNDKQFLFYTSQTYGDDPNLIYSTSSYTATARVAKVDVKSSGVDYEKMPAILGVTKREIDRGEYVVHLDGTSVERVEVISGGNRHRDPKAYVYDLALNGTGAICRPIVVDGIVTSIQTIEGGSGYTEPIIILVEEEGKYISLTEDIGQIQAMSVLNPGRSISPDRSLKPEIMIETRCVVKFDTYTAGSLLTADGLPDYHFISPNGYSNFTVIDPNYTLSPYNLFSAGDQVWQGTEDGSYKQVTAQFVSYDPRTQIITLQNVQGVLKDNEYLYNDYGAKGYVLLEGQADCRCVVSGIASPVGHFIDDTSMVSESYAHIQDSYYYQWFSYSISSPLQQKHYDNFVQNIIHPAGFIMFADVTVRDIVVTYAPENQEPIISGPVYSVLGPDGYGENRNSILSSQQRFEGEMLLSPNE